MTIKVEIGTPLVDRTEYLAPRSVHITRSANGVATFRGIFRADISAGYAPVRGQPLKISDGGATTWFAGNISRIQQRNPPGTGFLEFQVEASDYNRIPARRLISGSYGLGMSLYEIILRIVETGLSGEGITTNNVANDSPPVVIDESLIFSYETVRSAFDRLCAVAPGGYIWWIDFGKDLHFCLPTPGTAPFDLTDDGGEWFDLELEESDEDYRNRQHVRSQAIVASSAGSATGEFPWTASAGATVIPTRAVTAEVLEVVVDGIYRSFVQVAEGDGPPAGGYDFYYRSNWCGLYCLDHAPFAGGEICSVEYRPGYSAWVAVGATTPETTGPQVVTVDDAAEQAARAAIEGSSGIWEAVEEQRWLGSVAALEAIGAGRLRQYALDIEKPTFGTYLDGLEPGQQIHIHNTALALDDDYLIETVTLEWETGAEDFWRYRVQCTNAEPHSPPVSYLEKLAEIARIGPPSTGVAGNASSGSGSGSIILETPKGIKDGVNTLFWLTYQVMPPESLRLTVNGVIQNPCADYTLVDNVITFATAPDVGDTLLAWYFHGAKRTVPVDGGGDPLTQGRWFGAQIGDQLAWSDIPALIGNIALGVWVMFPSNASGPILSQGHHLGVHGMNFQLLVEGVSGAWDLRYKHQYGGTFGTNVTVEHLFDTNLPNNTWIFVGLSRVIASKQINLYVGYEGGEPQLVDAWQYTSYSEPANPAGYTYLGQCPGNWDAPLWPHFTAQEHYLWENYVDQGTLNYAMKGDLNAGASQDLVLACFMGTTPEIDVSPTGSTGTLGGPPGLVAGHH